MVVVTLALIVLGMTTGHLPVHDWLAASVAYIREARAVGVALFALLYVVATVFFLPGAVLTMGAGFAYGPVLGVLIVSPVSVLAASVAFMVGRFVARDWIARRVADDRRFAAIDDAIADEGFKIVMLLRLSPLFPFSLLNYALGLTKVSFRDYAVASWLGMLPATVLYVYLGSVVTSLGALSGRTRVCRQRRRAGLLLGGPRRDRSHCGRGHTDGAPRTGIGVGVARPCDHRSPLAVGVSVMSASMLDGSPSLVLPDDTFNRALIEAVHPPHWVNPTPSGRYNLVVIGAGTAGLVSAVGAAGLGAKVALVERHLLGGDCLNYGCVPSKALLRSAHAAHDVRTAAEFGIDVAAPPAPDFARVMARLRRLRAGIAPNDSVARMQRLGIDVFLGDATFLDPDTIDVGGQRLRFSRAILASGARAATLPVPGLADAGYYTNETIFSLTELPARFVVIGAGPIGCEMAQAFSRLGSRVTIVSREPQLLPREDADAAALLTTVFAREGIAMCLGASLQRVGRDDSGTVITFDRGASAEAVTADVVLLATGRTPNVEGLGLERAGIAFDKAGVTVDEHLRTSNPKVYAAGDVCTPYKFTHAADAMARIAIQNALFFGRKRTSSLVIPWSTFTSPEIAHVGMTAVEAAAMGRRVVTLNVALDAVDRAVLDGEAEGFARAHVDARSGRLLGATIVAAHAGDVIGELSLAMTAGLRMDALARTIHPYPTVGEIAKKLGDAWMRRKVTPRVRRLFTTFLRWRR